MDVVTANVQHSQSCNTVTERQTGFNIISLLQKVSTCIETTAIYSEITLNKQCPVKGISSDRLTTGQQFWASSVIQTARLKPESSHHFQFFQRIMNSNSI
jgi:hypothetical protein